MMNAIITIKNNRIADIQSTDEDTLKLTYVAKLKIISQVAKEAADQCTAAFLKQTAKNQIDLEDSINDIENGN